MTEEITIPISEAKEEVEIAMTRLALMHLSFTKTLVDELGEEKGKELAIKAIFEYGRRIGERTVKGGRDLPKFGVYSGEVKQLENGDFTVSECILAKTFRDYDELDLGSLYCFVDPAKSMAANIGEKMIHKTCEACGDNKCTFALVKTTDEDKEHYRNKDAKLKTINPYLVKK